MKRVKLVEIKGREILMDNGAVLPIPESVSVADKSVEGMPRCWHLGNSGSTRVVLTVGDTDDAVAFRLRKVS